MFEAVLQKEWRQLRILQLGGVVLGLVLPLVLLVIAEISRQGWLPFGSVSSYSVGELFGQPLIVLYGSLWALLALLVGSQVIAADRAEGTDRFLLERPISRTTVWRAKLAAGISTVLLFLVVHAVFYFALRAAFGGEPRAVHYLGIAAIPSALAFVGAAVAGSLVRLPMQAVLLGAVMAVLPVGLGALLTRAFPYSGVGEVLIATLIPVTTVLGFAVASWSAECRGEPAGRRRWKRAVTWVVVATVSVPVLFFVVAPPAMRWAAGLNNNLIYSPNHQVAITADFVRGGWIVAPEGGKRKFVPPPVHSAVWNAAGDRVAVLTDSGPFGSVGRMRIRVYDADGRVTLDNVPCDRCDNSGLGRMVWKAHELWVPRGPFNRLEGFLVIDTVAGTTRKVPVDTPPTGRVWTAGPDPDGKALLLVQRGETRTVQREGEPDSARGQFDVQEAGSGRRWATIDVPLNVLWMLRQNTAGDDSRLWPIYYSDQEPSIYLDVETQEEFEVPADTAWVRAMEGGRVAYATRDGALHLGRPGAIERVREWPGRQVLLRTSPEGRYALVRVRREYKKDGAPHWETLETWVLDVRSGEWQDIKARYPWLVDEVAWSPWAGEGRLAFWGRDWVVTLDVTTDELTTWRGEPPVPGDG